MRNVIMMHCVIKYCHRDDTDVIYFNWKNVDESFENTSHIVDDVKNKLSV